MKHQTVLDCTFRDGGYKTDWTFSKAQVEAHLAGTVADVVEIGYRANGSGSGAYRYCTDDHINTLRIPDSTRLAVMVNGSEWTPDLFLPKSESRIDVVRIAAHLDAIPQTEAAVKHVRDLGYFTCLNLMQCHRADDSVFERAYDADVVYFADSFGCMSARQVARITDKLKRHNSNVGFHGHNNMGQALHNTMVAEHHGANWLDASSDGAGRGAGNADLVDLLDELCRGGCTNLADLEIKHTIRSRLVYGVGALLKMHPKKVEPWV